MMKLSRYSKNLENQGITQEQQEKLLSSKVLVMGAGGLGSGVIMNLAAMGVGQIKVVDSDVVEVDNFNRQFIHKEKNLNRAKVISAKEWIQEFNSDIKVEIDKVRINDLNYYNVIQGYDIIVDCFDGYEAKYMLNEIALRHKIPLVHGGILGTKGQVTTIVPDKTGCLNCIVAKPKSFSKTQIATFSPIVNTISALQANEVFKMVTGFGEALLNKVLIFDGLKGQFDTINYSKSALCEYCNGSFFDDINIDQSQNLTLDTGSNPIPSPNLNSNPNSNLNANSNLNPQIGEQLKLGDTKII